MECLEQFYTSIELPIERRPNSGGKQTKFYLIFIADPGWLFDLQCVRSGGRHTVQPPPAPVVQQTATVIGEQKPPKTNKPHYKFMTNRLVRASATLSLNENNFTLIFPSNALTRPITPTLMAPLVGRDCSPNGRTHCLPFRFATLSPMMIKTTFIFTFPGSLKRFLHFARLLICTSLFIRPTGFDGAAFESTTEPSLQWRSRKQRIRQRT